MDEMFRSAASTPRAMRRLPVPADSSDEDESPSPTPGQRAGQRARRRPAPAQHAAPSITVAMTVVLIVANLVAALLGIKQSRAQALARPVGAAADQTIRTLCLLAGGCVGVLTAIQHELAHTRVRA
ncbi:hypothetical protein QBZ16_003145 [Prototheca wickerhamii]|uniref:Uncharacterized protein n=1 Tax=Prototheca wickerhamii TaxID=3111 RepID=A0AAD9IKZ1_PROWI|nr:hypothetical protein QBZ16_003145 [Prototheca wickerhamii]